MTWQGRRSTKVLASASAATAYQRSWFADLRQRVADGEPFAIVNADAPQEIFRTMGIPYVVNQWWASVCAAKQRSADYLGLLRARGYPDDEEQYSALAFASSLDPEPAGAPWGGLPRPTIVLAELTGDSQRKIFELWHTEHGATFYALERSVNATAHPRWWEHIDDDWEHVVGTERLDLMTAELTSLIRFLETTTGRKFDETRFRQVMALINEQSEHNRAARDLIAATVPAPISITDSIPSVMIPQWHRGTEWARDAARQFRTEIEERVAGGLAACPSERIRLMWIGTGLWFNLGFYQHFQDTYGAVFVWSMYLGIAADGYIRRGPDPLRALAARFVPFPDLLHMPPWSSEWYAKEAIHSQIDGVVHLISGGDRGQYFITRALESAGVPVLEIDADNVDASSWDDQAMTAVVSKFIEDRAAPMAGRRAQRVRAAEGSTS
jgi:hypothetical protein